jgi:hypothetical protein
MARAMVINYGFSEIGPFSLLDPSAQVRSPPHTARQQQMRLGASRACPSAASLASASM